MAKKNEKKGKKGSVQRPKKPHNSFKIFMMQMKKEGANQDDTENQN